jgi:hypothetical protein
VQQLQTVGSNQKRPLHLVRFYLYTSKSRTELALLFYFVIFGVEEVNFFSWSFLYLCFQILNTFMLYDIYCVEYSLAKKILRNVAVHLWVWLSAFLIHNCRSSQPFNNSQADSHGFPSLSQTIPFGFFLQTFLTFIHRLSIRTLAFVLVIILNC